MYMNLAFISCYTWFGMAMGLYSTISDSTMKKGLNDEVEAIECLVGKLTQACTFSLHTSDRPKPQYSTLKREALCVFANMFYFCVCVCIELCMCMCVCICVGSKQTIVNYS